MSQAAETAPSYLVTSILMLFLLAYGRRYFEGFVDQFPEERRDDMRTVGRAAALRGRQYLLVALGQSDRQRGDRRVGVLGARASRPPSASGFAVGVFTLLPLIGVLVGGIPALLLGFGLEGWQDGMIVLVVLIALQTIEAAVVRPIVDARTVRVGPTIPIIVALLGFELYGVGGAIYGIALAVIGLAALDAVGRLRGDDPRPTTPSRPGRRPSPTPPAELPTGASDRRVRTCGRTRPQRAARRYRPASAGSDHRSDCSSSGSLGLRSSASMVSWIRATASISASGRWFPPATRRSR